MRIISLLVVMPLLAPGQADDKKLRETFTSISDFLKQAKTPTALRAASEDLLALSEQAMEANAFDIAVKSLDLADKIAKTSKDTSGAPIIQSRLSLAKSLDQEWGKVRSFAKTLEQNPEDPDANLATGKFLCAWKGNWEKGLPFLAKGSDPTLRELAASDQSADGQADSSLQLAERWWTYSTKNPKFRSRSIHWYQAAWGSLKGIAKEKAREKFKQHFAQSGGRELPSVPPKWTLTGLAAPALRRATLSEVYAHTGNSSFRLDHAPNSSTLVMPEKPASPGKDYVLSFWILTNLIERVEGRCAVRFIDMQAKPTDVHFAIPADAPWWQKVEVKATAPDGTKTVALFLNFEGLTVDKGSFWIDDVSLRSDDKFELVENGSFELREK